MKYDLFFDNIQSCLKSNTPSKKHYNNKKHKNPISWCDEECNKLHRLRKAAYKKWLFTKNLTDRINYNKSNCKFVNTCKRKKKTKF